MLYDFLSRFSRASTSAKSRLLYSFKPSETTFSRSKFYYLSPQNKCSADKGGSMIKDAQAIKTAVAAQNCKDGSTLLKGTLQKSEQTTDKFGPKCVFGSVSIQNDKTGLTLLSETVLANDQGKDTSEPKCVFGTHSTTIVKTAEEESPTCAGKPKRSIFFFSKKRESKDEAGCTEEQTVEDARLEDEKRFYPGTSIKAPPWIHYPRSILPAPCEIPDNPCIHNSTNNIIYAGPGQTVPETKDEKKETAPASNTCIPAFQENLPKTGATSFDDGSDKIVKTGEIVDGEPDRKICGGEVDNVTTGSGSGSAVVTPSDPNKDEALKQGGTSNIKDSRSGTLLQNIKGKILGMRTAPREQTTRKTSEEVLPTLHNVEQNVATEKMSRAVNEISEQTAIETLIKETAELKKEISSVKEKTMQNSAMADSTLEAIKQMKGELMKEITSIRQKSGESNEKMTVNPITEISRMENALMKKIAEIKDDQNLTKATKNEIRSMKAEILKEIKEIKGKLAKNKRQTTEKFTRANMAVGPKPKREKSVGEILFVGDVTGKQTKNVGKNSYPFNRTTTKKNASGIDKTKPTLTKETLENPQEKITITTAELLKDIECIVNKTLQNSTIAEKPTKEITDLKNELLKEIADMKNSTIEKTATITEKPVKEIVKLKEEILKEIAGLREKSQNYALLAQGPIKDIATMRQELLQEIAKVKDKTIHCNGAQETPGKDMMKPDLVNEIAAMKNTTIQFTLMAEKPAMEIAEIRKQLMKESEEIKDAGVQTIPSTAKHQPAEMTQDLMKEIATMRDTTIQYFLMAENPVREISTMNEDMQKEIAAMKDTTIQFTLMAEKPAEEIARVKEELLKETTAVDKPVPLREIATMTQELLKEMAVIKDHIQNAKIVEKPVQELATMKQELIKEIAAVKDKALQTAKHADIATMKQELLKEIVVIKDKTFQAAAMAEKPLKEILKLKQELVKEISDIKTRTSQKTPPGNKANIDKKETSNGTTGSVPNKDKTELSQTKTSKYNPQDGSKCKHEIGSLPTAKKQQTSLVEIDTSAMCPGKNSGSTPDISSILTKGVVPLEESTLRDNICKYSSSGGTCSAQGNSRADSPKSSSTASAPSSCPPATPKPSKSHSNVETSSLPKLSGNNNPSSNHIKDMLVSKADGNFHPQTSASAKYFGPIESTIATDRRNDLTPRVYVQSDNERNPKSHETQLAASRQNVTPDGSYIHPPSFFSPNIQKSGSEALELDMPWRATSDSLSVRQISKGDASVISRNKSNSYQSSSVDPVKEFPAQRKERVIDSKMQGERSSVVVSTKPETKNTSVTSSTDNMEHTRFYEESATLPNAPPKRDFLHSVAHERPVCTGTSLAEKKSDTPDYTGSMVAKKSFEVSTVSAFVAIKEIGRSKVDSTIDSATTGNRIQIEVPSRGRKTEKLIEPKNTETPSKNKLSSSKFVPVSDQYTRNKIDSNNKTKKISSGEKITPNSEVKRKELSLINFSNLDTMDPLRKNTKKAVGKKSEIENSNLKRVGPFKSATMTALVPVPLNDKAGTELNTKKVFGKRDSPVYDSDVANFLKNYSSNYGKDSTKLTTTPSKLTINSYPLDATPDVYTITEKKNGTTKSQKSRIYSKKSEFWQSFPENPSKGSQNMDILPQNPSKSDPNPLYPRKRDISNSDLPRSPVVVSHSNQVTLNESKRAVGSRTTLSSKSKTDQETAFPSKQDHPLGKQEQELSDARASRELIRSDEPPSETCPIPTEHIKEKNTNKEASPQIKYESTLTLKEQMRELFPDGKAIDRAIAEILSTDTKTSQKGKKKTNNEIAGNKTRPSTPPKSNNKKSPEKSATKSDESTSETSSETTTSNVEFAGKTIHSAKPKKPADFKDSKPGPPGCPCAVSDAKLASNDGSPQDKGACGSGGGQSSDGSGSKFSQGDLPALVEDQLNRHVATEMGAFLGYFDMMVHFGRVDVSFRGMEAFFRKQMDEETCHAHHIVKWITVRGGDPRFGSVGEVADNQSTASPSRSPPSHIFGSSHSKALAKAVQMEKSVTHALHGIHCTSVGCFDVITAKYLSELFLQEQVESIEEIVRLLINAQRAELSPRGMLSFDEYLYKRCKHRDRQPE